jgi:hypothetical protein
MKLYFANARSCDGDSFDLFVRAETQGEIVPCLLDYYEIEVDQIQGDIRIVEVPLQGPAGALDWGDLFATGEIIPAKVKDSEPTDF